MTACIIASIILICITAAIFFMIIRVGAKSEKDLHEITERALNHKS